MKLAIGMAGTTGASLGVTLLQALRDILEVETHLVMSRWAKTAIELEMPWTARKVAALTDFSHNLTDQIATISSDSFRIDGTIAIPCSVKALIDTRAGYAEGLMDRAADIALKEGRKLVLIPQEMPFSAIHLKNMLVLPRMDVAMAPPMPAYYNHPETVDDTTNRIVTRALDQFGPDYHKTRCWNGLCMAEQFAQEIE